MFRLFISVYIAVVLGLLVINISSQWLWENFTATATTSEGTDEYFHLKPIFQTLPGFIQESEAKRKIFEQQSGYSLSFFSFDDVAWLAEQKQQLQAGKVVTSFDKNNQISFYIMAKNSGTVYQVTTTKISLPMVLAEHISLKYLILILSYILLAGLIVLLTRPLWRDIIQLRGMANSVINGNLCVSYKVSRYSPTKVVVESFYQMTQRITSLLQEQSHLINAVSHELRTPLSRLRFTLAMSEDIPSKPLKEITTDIDEMEHLVDEILNYSRIENLQGELHYAEVDVAEMLFHLVEKHQRSTEKKIHLKTGTKLIFRCDGHLFERACQNLLSNAVRYAETIIHVSASVEDEQLLVIVEDDGKGIADKDKAQLFLPFYKLDKSRNKNKGGFGLGLAITHRIVDLHKGRCDISQSQLGGAQFSLSIPNKVFQNEG